MTYSLASYSADHEYVIACAPVLPRTPIIYDYVFGTGVFSRLCLEATESSGG